jgi:cytochrome b561
VGTLSAATITLVLLVILRYANAFTRPSNVIEKIVTVSNNHSAFFAYAMFILIISIIFALGYGIAYTAGYRSPAQPHISP